MRKPIPKETKIKYIAVAAVALLALVLMTATSFIARAENATAEDMPAYIVLSTSRPAPDYLPPQA